MTYHYRTGTDKIKPYLNDMHNTVQNLKTELRELAYRFGLLEAPEVFYGPALPTPEEVA